MFWVQLCVIYIRNYLSRRFFFFQAEDGIRYLVRSRGLGDVYKRQVKSFTKSLLTFAFMIAYVYLACLLILSLARVAIRAVVDVVGQKNVLWLRNSIARERGIEAYRAWVPLERVRPAHIPQREWEEAFAWPSNNEPPYAPFWQRVLRGVLSYVVIGLLAAALLQFLTPFPALSWLFEFSKRAVGLQSG